MVRSLKGRLFAGERRRIGPLRATLVLFGITTRPAAARESRNPVVGIWFQIFLDLSEKKLRPAGLPPGKFHESVG
jgi:hypothetical protein